MRLNFLPAVKEATSLLRYTVENFRRLNEWSNLIESNLNLIETHLLSTQSSQIGLTNTAASGGTDLKWGTEDIQFAGIIKDVVLLTWLTGYTDIPDTVNSIGAARTRVSFDGGTNWTYGKESHCTTQRSGAALRIQRNPVSTLQVHTGIPTGTIIIEGRLRQIVALGGNATFLDGSLTALLLPVYS